MHRLIAILVLLALLAAPAQGLAMRMLDESGKPAQEQPQESGEQTTSQDSAAEPAAPDAPAIPKPATRAIIKAQSGGAKNPGAGLKTQ